MPLEDLLDENLPLDLRHHLLPHDVFTIDFMGWKGLKNGALLNAAAGEGFEAMLTLDNGLRYQQNVAMLPLSIVMLSAATSDIGDLLPLVPALLSRLSGLPLRSILRVP